VGGVELQGRAGRLRADDRAHAVAHVDERRTLAWGERWQRGWLVSTGCPEDATQQWSGMSRSRTGHAPVNWPGLSASEMPS
jgi:hypothetical protein